ncbi:hypothetical protein FACS1894208_11400 [Clostridia bacterium]|nr:hypothetical protein FACS1894208_11400 [Clostridia bacterium]
MAKIIDAYIDVGEDNMRGRWLIKQILELVELDTSINDTSVFYIRPLAKLTQSFKVANSRN